MSASADDATPAPDADDEAQPGPAGTAAEGSTTMAQEEEAGQPTEEDWQPIKPDSSDELAQW